MDSKASYSVKTKPELNAVGKARDELIDSVMPGVKAKVISDIRAKYGNDVIISSFVHEKLGGGAAKFTVTTKNNDGSEYGTSTISGTCVINSNGTYNITMKPTGKFVSKSSGSVRDGNPYNGTIGSKGYNQFVKDYVDEAKKRQNFATASSKAGKKHSIYHADGSTNTYYGVTYR